MPGPQAREPVTPRAFVHALRATDLFKLPGVAETLDWGHALVALGCVELDPATVDATLGVLLKYQDDLAKITGPTNGMIGDPLPVTCYACGDDVCRNCSTLIMYHKRRCRVCFNCQDTRKIGRAAPKSDASSG